MIPPGPFATELEARTAAHSLVPPSDGRAILSEDQNLELILRACEAAGVEMGAYDDRIAGWLAGWEDSICAVVAGWVLRAHAAGLAARDGGVSGEIRTRLRVHVAEYEQHRDRFPVAADDPDVAWWAGAWAERLVPVLKQILRGEGE